MQLIFLHTSTIANYADYISKNFSLCLCELLVISEFVSQCWYVRNVDMCVISASSVGIAWSPHPWYFPEILSRSRSIIKQGLLEDRDLYSSSALLTLASPSNLSPKADRFPWSCPTRMCTCTEKFKGTCESGFYPFSCNSARDPAVHREMLRFSLLRRHALSTVFY